MTMRMCKAAGARAAAMSLGAATLAAVASAQQPTDLATLCNPSSHALDAVRAAPYSHNVLLENDRVRVLEVILPPLAVEPPHIHALPSVIQGDTGGAEGARFLYIEYTMEDGRMVETRRQDITPSPGFRTVWSAPEGLHSIANIGSAPVRIMRTEIKPESCQTRAAGAN